MLYTTLLKGAYHIVHIVCSEVFKPSPVADTVQNLTFANYILRCAVWTTFCHPKPPCTLLIFRFSLFWECMSYSSLFSLC